MKKRKVDDVSQALFAELCAVRRDLAAAYARFDYTTEPELIDACIHDLGAIEARYSYLLRCIKEHGARAACVPLTEGTKQWV